MAVSVVGDGGGRWVVLRAADRWKLSAATAPPFDAEVVVPDEVAWKLLTRTIRIESGIETVQIRGEPRLADAATRAIAVMTTRL